MVSECFWGVFKMQILVYMWCNLFFHQWELSTVGKRLFLFPSKTHKCSATFNNLIAIPNKQFLKEIFKHKKFINKNSNSLNQEKKMKPLVFMKIKSTRLHPKRSICLDKSWKARMNSFLSINKTRWLVSFCIFKCNFET